jgi:hypothetical protein
VLVTNHTVTIAAELQNGRKIMEQCNISHPVTTTEGIASDTLEGLEDDESATSPYNVEFKKASQNTFQVLEANIDRTVAVLFFPGQY